MASNERSYGGFKRVRGDASRVDSNPKGQLALLVPTTDRDLHFASAADELTDWNVANPVHPTLYIHSETTPATEYGALSHDAADLTLASVGGGIILSVPDGETINVPDDRLLVLGTGDDVRLSWDTTDANANELLLQMPAGGAVNVPVLVIGQSVESIDLGLYNGVVDPRVALFGVGAVTTGPVIEFRKARGTVAAPTVTTTGDDLGTIDFYAAVAAAEYVRAASIRADVSGTIATTRGPGNLSFNVATDAAPSVLTERLLITGSGLVTLTPATDVVVADGAGLILGATAQITAGALSEYQQLGTALADSSMVLGVFSANAIGPDFQFVKSRGAAIPTNTIVVDNDVVGRIVWLPADGVDFATEAAVFFAEVDDATPAAGDIGMAFVWSSMAGGATALAERMRLSAAGDLSISDGAGIIVGNTTQVTLNALVPECQVQGTVVGVDGAVATVLYSATAAEGPEIILARSKSGTLGTNTIVANNDSLGRIVAMGADGGTGFDPAAAILFEVANVPGAAADMPGRILFQTSPDGSQTPATRLTILSGATTVAQAQLGTAGTSTGALLFGGVTSGVVTLTVAAAAGTWTMQLPAAVGAAGQQLTDAAGDGITSWAAASLGEWKNDLGILDPHEALAAVVQAPTHRFTYNRDVMPAGQWAPPDLMTGIFAEEAPWAMHGQRDGYRNGIAFSNVNAFGYARAAIQALYEDLQTALTEIANLTSQLATLKA